MKKTIKKHLLSYFLVFVYLVTIPYFDISGAENTDQFSAPLSKGTINKTTSVFWGKSEAFPVMGVVYKDEVYDVYEYTEEWVMILFDSYLSQGNNVKSHSFFGYIKRAEITCAPELSEGSSKKAETGLGKKKGKKPKLPIQSKDDESAGKTSDESKTTKENESDKGDSDEDESSSSDEKDVVDATEEEDFDWILRTPGLCSITVPVEQSNFYCSFSILAQKAGGIGPSSDAGFNHGIRTPYAVTAFFSMISPMQDTLNNSGLSKVLSGSGGVEIIGQAAGSTFYIDTASLDPSLVNFDITLNATATLDPQVTDGNITGSIGKISTTQSFPLPVQLKKSGNSYKFVLKGMKPGGGDLEFPAVLEKTFSDENRWEKAAKEADQKRKEAERIRKKILDMIKKQVQEEWTKQNENSSSDQKVTSTTTELPELAPLEPLGPELAPLEPLGPEDEATSDEDSDSPVLAPLWPLADETVKDFPSEK